MTALRDSTYLDQASNPNRFTLQWINELLWELGIPLNVHGYHYLVDAVILTLSDPQMATRLTHHLYPTVAQHYQTSASCVERSIRHAIELAWTRGNLAQSNDIFGRSINLAYEKPTNGEMISLLTEKVRARIYESEHSRH